MSSAFASTLAPESWPFSLELLPQSTYVVGGAVRDALLKRVGEYLDLDFVVPCDPVEVARQIAKLYKAGFVLLDPQRQIARVVFKSATADFARTQGDSLESDLRRRDFTVNAIAYNPHTKQVFDPLGGCADIERRVLRMISPANLEEDPLRLLRAYRQACQLDFTIEASTQATIRTLAPYLVKIAPERIRVEIGYMLLAGHEGSFWLQQANKDGLLQHVFSHATPESYKYLIGVDKAGDRLAQIWPRLGEMLYSAVRPTLKTTWLGIAKLACLVDPNPEVAEIELQDLTYSHAEIQAVITALKHFPRLCHSTMSLREQYFFFQQVGKVFPITAVLSVAWGTPVEAIADLINRYLNPDDLVAHPVPLVDGKQLMSALNIPASPLVGQLLTEIAIARIEGKISTAAQALAFAAQFVKENCG
jgi:tRNA nucleotidyltransferase (CCA-adding enzyme)